MDVNSIKYLVDPPYPPTASGRYARWRQKESGRDPGEPVDRIWCVWSEESPDRWFPGVDYCECVECGPTWGRVLIGWGAPPEGCEWLPAGWPAGLFPLGFARAHLVGWRGLVLAGVTYDPDPFYNYTPKVRWGYPGGGAEEDEWECGWLALVRATRQLARHYDLISNDRLLAPYPGTRYDARPDVEPILDELVRFASLREVTTGPSTAPCPEQVVPVPVLEQAPPGRPRWDADTRTLFFGNQRVKCYGSHPAKSQTELLIAFENAGWPVSIASGLQEHAKKSTIKDLNKSLGTRSPITFHGNGTKQGIRWQPKKH